MKTIYSAALAAFVGAVAAKDESTFAVLHFTGLLTQGRMDPIVSPGVPSQHVHGVLGGSGFKMGATGDDLLNSECSTAKVKGDNSAYWFPTLYFRDPSTTELEPVPFYYANVYYFFEPTDDTIVAFPPGLKIVAGDALTRVAPQTGPGLNLDPSNGPISNVQWSCPRLNYVYDPPSWQAGSDGSMAGIGNQNNLEAGIGFPNVNCDGTYSPLRADVHMPSCYNPDKGLDNYQENMVFPEDNGSGKLNCPEGHTHVPHLFFEVYWDTPAFNDRWTSNSGTQPFVLSNGDATGFSSHADFFAGWDEGILQGIIDTCNTGTSGMESCPGVTVIEDPCSVPSEVDEVIDGVLPQLPGDNPIRGWAFGTGDAKGKPTAEPTSTAEPTTTPVPNPFSQPESSRRSKRSSRRHLHAHQHRQGSN